MRVGVGVLPIDGVADVDGEICGIEGEVLDGDGVRGRRGRRAVLRGRRSGERRRHEEGGADVPDVHLWAHFPPREDWTCWACCRCPSKSGAALSSADLRSAFCALGLRVLLVASMTA